MCMASEKEPPALAGTDDEPGETITPFWAGRRGGLLIGIALCGSFAGYIFYNEGIVGLAFVVAAVAGALLVQLVRRRAGRAISRAVQTGPDDGRPTAAPPDAAAPAPVVREIAGDPLPFSVELLEVASMPAVSAGSKVRFDVIHTRGIRLRRLYRRAVLMVALVISALTFAAHRISPDVGLFAYLIPLMLALTLVFLAYDAARWGQVERQWRSDRVASERSLSAHVGNALTVAAQALTISIGDSFHDLLSTLRRARGGDAAERDRWEAHVVPLQPVLVPLLGACWLVISAVETVAYIDPSGIAFVVPIVLYLIALRRAKAGLERRYPVDAPLNLLTLRVFSSPSLQDFILLTDDWRWFGPMQRLDGSDTAGSSMRDVTAYLRGDIADVIVEDERELAVALAAFRTTPDGHLRYPLNSMQCNDATWKQALQALVEDADAVVMDLSGFNEERRGCAYEIGTLIDQVPLRRFALLVNEGTDMAYLRRVLQDAWLSMPDGSPNAAAGDPVRILRIPPDVEKVESERVVGALLDAASQDRDRPAARAMPWARPGLPRFCLFL